MYIWQSGMFRASHPAMQRLSIRARGQSAVGLRSIRDPPYDAFSGEMSGVRDGISRDRRSVMRDAGLAPTRLDCTVRPMSRPKMARRPRRVGADTPILGSRLGARRDGCLAVN